MVYIMRFDPVRQTPHFFPHCGFAEEGKTVRLFSLDKGEFPIRPCCHCPKSDKKQKNFEKGIDFMDLRRYNAYLYEMIWEQEV